MMVNVKGRENISKIDHTYMYMYIYMCILFDCKVCLAMRVEVKLYI